MTEREALLIALERLKEWVDHSDCLEDKQAISAIEETLAQPEQEPVQTIPSFTQLQQIIKNLEHCLSRDSKQEFLRVWIRDWTEHKLSQNTQPQRKPLTGEMTKQMRERCDSYEMRGAFVDGWVSAEAAHGIKD